MKEGRKGGSRKEESERDKKENFIIPWNEIQLYLKHISQCPSLLQCPQAVCPVFDHTRTCAHAHAYAHTQFFAAIQCHQLKIIA